MDDTGYTQGEEWNTPGNLASYFDQDAWNSLGYSGDIWNTNIDVNGGNDYNSLTPEALAWMDKNGYSLKGSALPGNGSTLASLVNGQGNTVKSAYYNDADPIFGALVDAGVAAVTGGALGGGGLAGGLGFSGGGWIPGAINGAVTGATVAAGNDQNPLTGAATGAVGGGIAGFNPAGQLGVSNPILSKGINAATGSTLSSLASGKSLSEAAKAGATSGALTGGTAAMNNFDWGGVFKNYLGDSTGGADDFDSLQGSGGDMSGQTDVSANTYDENSPAYRYSGPQAPVTSFLSGGSSTSAVNEPAEEQKQILGLTLPTTGQLGSFLSGNAGTLAQTLYGLYNNRRQQSALGSQIAGLQGLYGQNSPYATQLRAKLQAQAAAQGKRSNTDARETQLQAMLADKAASLAPSLYQMQQGQMGLQNNNMAILGGAYRNLKGLSDLFNIGGNTYSGGGANITGVQNPYGSDVVFNGWGG